MIVLLSTYGELFLVTTRTPFWKDSECGLAALLSFSSDHAKQENVRRRLSISCNSCSKLARKQKQLEQHWGASTTLSKADHSMPGHFKNFTAFKIIFRELKPKVIAGSPVL